MKRKMHLFEVRNKERRIMEDTNSKILYVEMLK